jgi:hypothetical protein
MAKVKLVSQVEAMEAAFRTLKPGEEYEPGPVLELMELADATIKMGQAAKKKIQTLLQQQHAGLTKHLFSLKGTDTGTVHQHIGVKHEVSIVKRKKVDWDQEHLSFLASDDAVSPYIETKFNVREAEYEKASPMVRDKLDGGRTVTPSDPVFTIKER